MGGRLFRWVKAVLQNCISKTTNATPSTRTMSASSSSSSSSLRVVVVSVEVANPCFSGNGTLSRSLIHELLQLNCFVYCICASPLISSSSSSSSCSSPSLFPEEWFQLSALTEEKGKLFHNYVISVSSSCWSRHDLKGPWREFASGIRKEKEKIFEELAIFRPDVVLGVDWSSFEPIAVLMQEEKCFLEDDVPSLLRRRQPPLPLPLPLPSSSSSSPSSPPSMSALAVSSLPSSSSFLSSVPFVYLNFRVFYSASSLSDPQEIDFYSSLERRCCAAAHHSVSLSPLDVTLLQQLFTSLPPSSSFSSSSSFSPPSPVKISYIIPPLSKGMEALARKALQKEKAEGDGEGEGDGDGDGDGEGEEEREYLLFCCRRSKEKNPELFVQLVKHLWKRWEKKRGSASSTSSSSSLPRKPGGGRRRRRRRKGLEGVRPLFCGSSESKEYERELNLKLLRICPDALLLGSQNQIELAKLYKRSILNFHCATYEPYGLTIIEAAAFGTPSIVHHTGIGATSLLRRGRKKEDKELEVRKERKEAEAEGEEGAEEVFVSDMNNFEGLLKDVAALFGLSEEEGEAEREGEGEEEEVITSKLEEVGRRAQARALSYSESDYAQRILSLLSSVVSEHQNNNNKS